MLVYSEAAHQVEFKKIYLKKSNCRQPQMTHPAPQTIHTQLGPAFYDAVTPARFPRHILRYRNQAAADQIGLAGLSDDDFIDHFARFTPLPGTLAEPLALRYHGHQFGTYNPELGDGRGFLFAQYSERQTGRLLDLGTKGSGRTPYARTADGRLTLKGGVREVLATELLSALDVPTSQTFSLIETGEDLHRHDEPSPTRSSVLVRLSHSHIRIGSFQRLSYLGQTDNLELLLRHTVRHYYPDIDPDQDYEALILAFLPAFALRVSDMVAGWMVAGFVHGVLNTDNFNITGESFDYGPWRFLPHLDPGFTAAYFDQTGRYAYGRQPSSAMWALCRLADCFVPLHDPEILAETLAGFYPAMEHHLARRFCWRLGVDSPDEAAAAEMSGALFEAAKTSQIGWDRLFHDLYGGRLTEPDQGEGPDPAWQSSSELRDLAGRLARFAPRQPDMAIRAVKSAPLVSLDISVVEGLWAPIAEADDWAPLNQAIDDIRTLAARLRA